VSTASWGYLRLRKPIYRKPQLVKWLKEIASREWEEAFVFFKHEDQGAGPKLASRFVALWKAM
jgi:uncharacterized protein YecE (DUF72 family)